MMEVEDSYDPDSLPALLPLYYKRCFPFKHYVGWLSYGHPKGEYWAHREIAFILKGDVHLRYQSFGSEAEFEKAVLSLNPEKIDIGPVYSHPPSERKRVQPEEFQARERELVFDIDLTDYDDTRQCCQGGDVCTKCWRLMTAAVVVMEAALREDFGFRHTLWIFSGRRGVHCWVADKVARSLSNDARASVAEYLQVLSGGEKQRKKVSLPSPPNALHPAIDRAVKILTEQVDLATIAEEQGWLADDDSVRRMMELISDSEIAERVETNLLSLPAPSRWRGLELCLSKEPTDKVAESNLAWKEIVLQLAYPRLDINVSKGTNHLLKSPFVIHPKTGKVAVPINPGNAHLFDPGKVPTLFLLHSQLSQMKENESNSNRRPLDYKRTDLADYVAVFANFVDELLKDDAETKCAFSSSSHTLQF